MPRPFIYVGYKDLCKNPGFFKRIKAFVDRPIPDIGEVSAFNDLNPNLRDEADLRVGALRRSGAPPHGSARRR